MQTELNTARLTLRRTQPSDFEAMHALVSDFEVVKMTASWPFPADKVFTTSRCTPFPPEKGLGGPVFLGAELIGMMGVNESPDGPGIGYMFARSHWGHGYATEIGHAMIAHAFATYDWPKIHASIIDDNPSSGRVLEKLGFVKSGTSTGPCAARGADMPMIDYLLTRPKA